MPGIVSLMKKEELRVDGMCCFSCATTIEREVCRLKGVKGAIVDYKKGMMTVEYDESLADKAKIQDAAQTVIRRMKETC